MGPNAGDGLEWRDVTFSRAPVAALDLQLPPGHAVTGSRNVIAHGSAAGLQWMLQSVETRVSEETAIAFEGSGHLLEFFAIVGTAVEGESARLPLVDGEISGVGHRFRASVDDVYWVVAVPASASTLEVRLDDGRVRSPALLPVPSTDHAAAVFIVPAASRAAVTARTGSGVPDLPSRALPAVPRGSGDWHATKLPPLGAPSGEQPERSPEALSDAAWLAWRRRTADVVSDAPLPRAIYVIPPPNWCVHVRWELAVSAHEASVGYADHDAVAQGGRDLMLTSTDHDAVVEYDRGRTTGTWMPDPHDPMPTHFHARLMLETAGTTAGCYGDVAVRHAATRPLLVGGTPRTAHTWRADSEPETVIVRIDMPQAWLTVEASGIDDGALEELLQRVEPLEAGTVTFRALRQRSSGL